MYGLELIRNMDERFWVVQRFLCGVCDIQVDSNVAGPTCHRCGQIWDGWEGIRWDWDGSKWITVTHENE